MKKLTSLLMFALLSLAAIPFGNSLRSNTVAASMAPSPQEVLNGPLFHLILSDTPEGRALVKRVLGHDPMGPREIRATVSQIIAGTDSNPWSQRPIRNELANRVLWVQTDLLIRLRNPGRGRLSFGTTLRESVARNFKFVHSNPSSGTLTFDVIAKTASERGSRRSLEEFIEHPREVPMELLVFKQTLLQRIQGYRRDKHFVTMLSIPHYIEGLHELAESIWILNQFGQEISLEPLMEGVRSTLRNLQQDQAIYSSSQGFGPTPSRSPFRERFLNEFKASLESLQFVCIYLLEFEHFPLALLEHEGSRITDLLWVEE